MSFGISAGAWLASGAAVGGAVINKNSTKKAANAQQAAAEESSNATLTAQREAQAYQERLDNRAYADSAPYREVGTNALRQLASAPNFTGANLASEPGYQFGLMEGNRALSNSAAARGGLLSGAALKASTRYAQDYASSKYNEAFSRDAQNKNRLASLAGIGQTAVGQSNSLGANLGQAVGAGMIGAAQSVGNNITGAANARASSYLANGNTLSNGLNQGISAWNNYNRLASPLAEGAYNQTDNFNYYGTGYSP